MKARTPTNETEVEKSTRKTHWPSYVAYRCSNCLDDCINRRDAARSKYGECRLCFDFPDLESAEPAASSPAGSSLSGTSVPIEREHPSRSAKRENTAFLGAKEVSGKALLEEWPRAPLYREGSDD